MDTILGILPGESYSNIRVLADLSMCIKYTNKLSGAVAGETVAELTSSLANILSFILSFILLLLFLLAWIPLLSINTLNPRVQA